MIRDRVGHKNFEEIMAKNFQNLICNINTDPRSSQTKSRMNITKITSRYIIIKLLTVKSKKINK